MHTNNQLTSITGRNLNLGGNGNGTVRLDQELLRKMRELIHHLQLRDANQRH